MTTRTDHLALHPEGCECFGHKEYAKLETEAKKLWEQLSDAVEKGNDEDITRLTAQHDGVTSEMDELRYGSE